MAMDTSKALRNQVMYSVFVRQYSKEGTFDKVREDLPRIKALGVDVIWLMPIHPIGKVKRKGTLGSPYAISDYRAVNPEFGTMADFIALTDAVHALGMKVIIDVVYNHTSPDSVLAREHPEWFYHRADGSFGNRIGDWSDIIDLDYGQKGLWDYQIETLKLWARYVDGFRCDVAPLIPLEFWLAAREAVAQVRPGCLWLSESVEPEFTRSNRARGMVSLSDAEIFRAFDLSYEYDVYPDWVGVLTGRVPLAEYLKKINEQEAIYPENYVKLRFLENHDRPRARFSVPDAAARENWTAFLYFQRGMTLLYNGQERECFHRPSLFEKDDIPWDGPDISERLRALAAIKRDPIFRDGSYSVRDGGNGVIVAEYTQGARRLLGLFSTQGKPAPVPVCVPDGRYANLIDGGAVEVECGLACCDGRPMVIECNEQ
ncbi:MAG: alpha-amylase [Clostridia bacterium]|nr:alpha-amylase [Clostridia bacterium]